MTEWTEVYLIQIHKSKFCYTRQDMRLIFNLLICKSNLHFLENLRI